MVGLRDLLDVDGVGKLVERGCGATEACVVVTRGGSECHEGGAWPCGRAVELRAGNASAFEIGERPGTMRPEVALRDCAVLDLSLRTRRPELILPPREAARFAELGGAFVAEA